MKNLPVVPKSSTMQLHDTSRFQRRTVAQGNNDDTGWLITLSDLTLLLFCFLAIWYVKQQQRDATAQSTKSVAQTPHESSTSKEDVAANANAEDWRALKDELAGFLADAGMSEDVDIKVAPDEILISFKDSIPFESGKADLKPQALPVMEKVAGVAVSRPSMYLRVNGHTDDRPISTAEFPSNWELSSARASRVARHLIEKGVHPARIEVHGFAFHRPRAANENRSGRGANRRVEISLLRSSGAKGGQNRQTSTP
jgi:chemotaxis protein MotB